MLGLKTRLQFLLHIAKKCILGKIFFSKRRVGIHIQYFRKKKLSFKDTGLVVNSLLYYFLHSLVPVYCIIYFKDTG